MVDDDFAWRLRVAMELSELNKTELSRRSGVDRKQIVGYATGTSLPNITNLRKLKNALCCTWEELLGE